MAVQTTKGRDEEAVVFNNILFLLHASFSAEKNCLCIFKNMRNDCFCFFFLKFLRP